MTNARCKESTNNSQDAFSQIWSDLTNWCDPPFSKTGQVVNKLAEEPPDVLVVVPDLPTCRWLPTLQSMGTREIIRACGARDFELNGRPVGPNRCRTWVLLYQHPCEWN